MRMKLVKSLVREFILAGKSTLTCLNNETKIHKTFRITKSEDGRVYFVSIRGDKDRQSDNKKKWLYLGMIKGNNFFTTKNSKVTRNSQSFRSFKWLMDASVQWELGQDKFPKVDVFHEGQCGSCGRKLTDPLSIERGFGPSCYQRRVVNG